MAKKDNSNFRHRMPADIKAVLNKKQNSDVKEKWESLTSLARNEWLCWVTFVKKEQTRAEHLKRLTQDIRAGHKRPCCWPGCPHRRVSAQKWFAKEK